jgi:hypothetical protein
MRTTEPCRHHIKIIFINQYILEIPIHWVRQPQRQIFIYPRHYFTSRIEYIRTVFNQLLECQFFRSNSINFIILFALNRLHYQISHIFNMNIL